MSRASDKFRLTQNATVQTTNFTQIIKKETEWQRKIVIEICKKTANALMIVGEIYFHWKKSVFLNIFTWTISPHKSDLSSKALDFNAFYVSRSQSKRIVIICIFDKHKIINHSHQISFFNFATQFFCFFSFFSVSKTVEQIRRAKPKKKSQWNCKKDFLFWCFLSWIVVPFKNVSMFNYSSKKIVFSFLFE